jgi:hypothetical protein
MDTVNRWLRTPAFWGILLILGGVAMLVQNLLDIRLGGLFWGAAFLLGGLAFIMQANRPEQPWWPYIPGITMVGIGAAILLDAILPGLSDLFSGLLILGGIGLAFLLIYLRDRRHWWALIPSGTMLTLAVVSVLDQVNVGFDTGGVFLIGLGLTFLVVAWLPDVKQQWAYIPGGILVVIGLLVAAASGEWLNIVGPALIIIVGGWLIFRSMRNR